MTPLTPALFRHRLMPSAFAFSAASILALLAPVAGAQTATWTGAGDGVSWSDPANWDGTPPVAGDPGAGVSLDFTPPATTGSAVDGLFEVESLFIGRAGAGSHVFEGVAGGSLVLLYQLNYDTDSGLTFALPVVARGDVNGFVDVTTDAVAGAGGDPAFLAFTEDVTLEGGTVLSFNNTGRSSFDVQLFAGLHGEGSLQVGTGHFTTGTHVTLHGTSTFDGDLRLRNDVTVADTADAAGSLAQVFDVFIESPVNFANDRATLTFGGPDGPVAASHAPRFAADTWLFLDQGALVLGARYDSAVDTVTEDVVEHLELLAGHSALTLVNDASNSANLGTYQLRIVEGVSWAGATAVVRGLDGFDPFSALSTLGTAGPGGTRVLVDDAFADVLLGGDGSTATNRAIVPFLVGDSQLAGYEGSEADTFLTYYDGSGGGPLLGLVPLGPGAFVTDLASVAADGTDNLSIDGGVLADHTAINALRFVASPDNHTLDLAGNFLGVASGTLLLLGETLITDSSFDWEVGYGTGAIAFGLGDAEPVDGFIYAYGGTSVVQAALVGFGDLTVSGDSRVQFIGDNQLTGTVFLNTDVESAHPSAFGVADVLLHQDVKIYFAPTLHGYDYENIFVFEGSGSGLHAINASPTLWGDIYVEAFVPGERVSVYWTTEVLGDAGAGLTVEGDVYAEDPADLVLYPGGTTQIVVHGTISDSEPGGLRVFARGPGTVEFTGDNFYTGDTVIEGGTFLANNFDSFDGSATGEGRVTVLYDAAQSTAAVLAGSGRVAGDTTVRGGAVDPGIYPGSTGELTFGGDLTFETATTPDGELVLPELRLQLGEAASWDYDGLYLNAEAPTLFLNDVARLVLEIYHAPLVGDLYHIVLSDEPLTISGRFVYDTTPLDDGATFVVNTWSGPLTFSIDYGSDFINLQLVAIPEPATWAALAGGLALGAALWRRRRR